MKQQYGYMRVSTKEQNELRQLLALTEFGIDEKFIYMDKQSGKDFERPKYQQLVHKILRQGDLLVVKNIDRLGRNYKEILEEWRYVTKELHADIKILDMPLLDTRPERDLVGTLISDIVLQLLSFVAESERDSIRKRQAEGIAAAQLKGVHMGRPIALIPETFPNVYHQWKSGEISRSDGEALCNLSTSAFYRLVHKYECEQAGSQSKECPSKPSC